MNRLFLAVPHTGTIVAEAIIGLSCASKTAEVTIQPRCDSILTKNFNALWCQALNAGIYTHFCLHHSDIAAEPWWADTMLEEMDSCGADVLSAVVPLKDERGLTSTAVMSKCSDGIERLTMAQVSRLQPTFSAADVSEDGPSENLLVNTGLMMVKLSDAVSKVRGFQQQDRLSGGSGYAWSPRSLPEDWDFSIRCHDAGLKVMATTKVKLGHWGRKEYRNDHVWGQETDTGG